MEFRVLGPVEVADGNQVLAPRRGKERHLLAVLLAHANHTVPADSVAEALWPGQETPAHAVRSVQTYVSRLRSALGSAGGRLLTRPTGYVLQVGPDELDARRFELLLEEARRRAEPEPENALILLDRALALWRGAPYGEFRDEDFALGDAVRLEELRLAALEERIDARLALGRHEEEVARLEALCAEHPFRERLRRQVMVALYRSGRQADALRAFETYRRTLSEELGLEPSPELRALELRILNHEAALGPRRPGPAPRGVLVAAVNSFIGREADAAEVIRRLDAARVLTLTGPGGVGKTRLALYVAATVAGRFPDGVVVCELAPVADPDAVAPAVATALGIQARSDRSVDASVADVLQARNMLLVLDNCEHVVDAAAGLLTVLVARCPQITALATSRERLAIDGEQVWPLDPLQLESAVDLFCDRARAVRPDVDCTGEARTDIVEACRRLDGLPLAIELAAARAAAMSPADLVARLDDRFLLLDHGGRSRPERHRSLRAVVDWSYERLETRQRQLFDRLSVFAGGFTLEAAEEVCAGDGVARAEIPALIAELVEVSLVVPARRDGTTRYQLLETLRTYGRDRLQAEGAARRWQQRHADSFVALARRSDQGLCAEDEDRWMRRVGAEIDNLRAAHLWAVSNDHAGRALALSAALHGYAHRTLRPEVFAWAERAARLPGAGAQPLLPLALGSAALGACVRGDLGHARELGQEAVEAAAGAPEGYLGFQALAAAALFSGDLAGVRNHGRRALELADAYGDQYQAIVTRIDDLLALAYGGETAEALDQAQAVLVTAQSLGCPSAIAWAQYALGEVLLDHDPVRAMALLDESHEVAAQLGCTFLTGVAGVSATTLRARHGDPGEALRRFPELIDLWERAGNRTQLWTMLRSLITTFVRLGRDEPAAVIYGGMQASRTAAPVYGPDAERLTSVLRDMEGRVGPVQLATWVEQGRQMRDDEVVAFARAATAAGP
jgi:predicted ATPase/DNA-binding SARP family transcriptional activator